jgi:hypothetical protein
MGCQRIGDRGFWSGTIDFVAGLDCQRLAAITTKFKFRRIFEVTVGAYRQQRRCALAAKLHAFRVFKSAFCTAHGTSTKFDREPAIRTSGFVIMMYAASLHI